MFMALTKVAGAERRPSVIRLYSTKEELTTWAVLHMDSSSNSICRKPIVRSRTENTLPAAAFSKQSCTTGMGRRSGTVTALTRRMSTTFRKPDQIIQPYHFGHEASKSTCLWLKGLPLLKHTNVVGKGEFVTYKSGKRTAKWYADAACHDAKTRAKIRNTTFQGIADAMAQQWG